jgi:hypothetical protein
MRENSCVPPLSIPRSFAVIAATLIPVAVCAQDNLQNWPGFMRSGLSTVYVLDDMGTEVSGRFLSLNPDSVVLLVDGVERRFESDHVRRIQKRGDSLRNGALIGAIAGAAMGLLAGGISDCPGNDPGGSCPGTRAAIAFVSTAVYAGIGSGIDALIPGRTTLYSAPPRAPSTGGRPTARLSGGRATVSLTLRW